jgi:hypothetical protein
MKAYNIDHNTFSEYSQTETNLGLYHGHRFDHKKHNWIIKKQCMSLGFSYMSFVIKEEIEQSEGNSNHFDIESNYIFNRSSVFLDSQYVSEDHFTLEYMM